MTESAVSIRGLSFAYPGVGDVIRDCSFDVTRGRALAILGPNGSGKTTLLKMIAGALTPTVGVVKVHGVVGYVAQLIQVGFAYSVVDVVLMGRARHVGLFSTPSANDARIAANALERVGMSAFASRSFDALSGGERQLVVLARALAAEADILVLDEPMGALDLLHQQTVLGWIRRLVGDGLTVIFSTHQPQHADVVADDVALIGGHGVFETGPADVMLEPARLARLFGVELRRAGESGVLVPHWNL